MAISQVHRTHADRVHNARSLIHPRNCGDLTEDRGLFARIVLGVRMCVMTKKKLAVESG